ncbi:MAG: hypothetical protein J2P21_27765, partial [Chloracidobacterium sp.]|nr:hypothetical protein [Chloracidobacterium sp.]
TQSAWLYQLLKPLVGEVTVCDPRHNKLIGDGNVGSPPFGAMLPVRTMGALYTLRPGLARFELTRDVRGPGWQMRKGATLIGQQQGANMTGPTSRSWGLSIPNQSDL